MTALATYNFCANAHDTDSFAATTDRESLSLDLEDLVAQRLLMPQSITISPDGEWIAYVATRPRALDEKEFDVASKGYFTSTGVGLTYAFGDSDLILQEVNTGKTVQIAGQGRAHWAPAWSPDGLQCAFFSDRDGLARLWIWDRSRHEIRRVSELIVRSFGFSQIPRWSPDSRRILVPTLHPGTPITGQPQNAASDAFVSAGEISSSGDIARVLKWVGATDRAHFEAEAKAEESESSVGGRATFDSALEEYFADLTLVDAYSNESVLLANAVNATGYWFSPDEKMVAFVSKSGGEAANRDHYYFDLVTVELATGAIRIVASNIKQGTDFSAVSWSPDSRWLSFADGDGNLFFASPMARKPRSVDTSSINHEGGISAYRTPLWDARSEFVYLAGSSGVWRSGPRTRTAQRVASFPDMTIVDIVRGSTGHQFWTPKSDTLVIVARQEKTQWMGFYSVGLQKGDVAPLHEAPGNFAWGGGSLAATSVDRTGDRIIYTSEAADSPMDIWTADATFQKRNQTSHLNPQFERYEFGPSQIVDWRSLDGEELHGALLLPPTFKPGVRYPLVVKVYGGYRNSRNARFFGGDLSGWNSQMFATRGYAVLEPDVPYDGGRPMYDLLQSVMPGVDRVIELGIVDPERLAVFGQSNGGYSTLALITQTKRFKAAIASASYSDLASIYSNPGTRGDAPLMGLYESQRGLGLGGTPWQVRERYIENSPFYFLDRVETPLLMMHGSLDDLVPKLLPEQTFASLRRLDKTVTLVEYAGEGHGLLKAGNLKDAWRRIFEWLDAYLFGASPDIQGL